MGENKSALKIHKINQKERGSALAIAIIIVAILSVVALTALAFSSTEARIAGSDLQRTQTFYATTAAMEKMTNDFNNLFHINMRPTTDDLDKISDSYPTELKTEGFSFDQTLVEDTERLNEMRATQKLPGTIYPRVNIPDGPYAGLNSSIIPYKMSSTGKMDSTQTEVKLEREFNNYLVPLFQFGIYSNEDLEFAPGTLMTFNGRIHSNRNIYALRNIKFFNRLSMAGEFIRDATRGGLKNMAQGSDQVWFQVNGVDVQSTKGSMESTGGTVGGPRIAGATAGQRGFHPFSPYGATNSKWETDSVKPANGTKNQLGGQVLTNTTGAKELKTPLELAGNSPAEIIKRALPTDSEILSTSRYHNKAQIRILIDDETAGNGVSNVAGIPADRGGVLLSTFMPSVLGSGDVLRVISDTGTVGGSVIAQKNPDDSISANASTVRTVKKSLLPSDLSNIPFVPPGSGIEGKILIEIVKPDGSTEDVTQTILSMGVTEGEPNGIVYVQRPLWAAYVQGSRDRNGNGFDLVHLTNSNPQIIADGEIKDPTSFFDAKRGFITFPSVLNSDEDAADGKIIRQPYPLGFDEVIPINVYNVREGWYKNALSENEVHKERGITSVIELNMRNLARWVDGVYDNNLLAGTNAVSENIKGDEGYVVYVSDRRGDQKKQEFLDDGTAFISTNGAVDNEDIYGQNGLLDEGEDVIDFGWYADAGVIKSKKGNLQKDTSELPDTSTPMSVPLNPSVDDRRERARQAMFYQTNYFRRSVRLFDGEKLSLSAAAEKLSPTKGITVSSENMVYIWGNYNTTGVSVIPIDGSTLNNGGFLGAQIPSSIVCDAFFPLSKTWYDSLSAMFPEGSSNSADLSGEAYRLADENLPSVSQGTAVRAGIIAGTTISTLNGTPGRNDAGLRGSGGIINYPRFLEIWNIDDVDAGYIENAWSYTGSFIPLFRSTQAISQWENNTSVIYTPPRRNWSFDQTYLDPNRLPPGTPFFQYVQATGFRQVLR